jgi:hypothetical protein
VTKLPAPADTAAPPRLIGARRRAAGPGRRPNRPPAIVTPAHRAASLTDLSLMVTRVHAIRCRGGVARDLDQRLTGLIAELESLIHDLLHDTDPASNGAKPSTKARPAGAAERTRAEAAFTAWLTSADTPDVWRLDGPDAPPVSLTRILGDLALSRRQLPTAAAAALGMPTDATLGYAAAALIVAVNDPAGPRCRSYRSAVFYLRDLDEALGGE